MKIDIPLNKDHEVNIGSHVVKVKFVPKDHPRVDEGYGSYYIPENTVYINKDEPDSFKFSTYLHELIHAIEQIYTFEIEHQELNLIAEALAQALTISEEKKNTRKQK